MTAKQIPRFVEFVPEIQPPVYALTKHKRVHDRVKPTCPFVCISLQSDHMPCQTKSEALALPVIGIDINCVLPVYDLNQVQCYVS